MDTRYSNISIHTLLKYLINVFDVFCQDKSITMECSGGSRISRWEGAPTDWGGTNLQRVHFSAKTYAKTKEIDPVGGGGGAPAAPPWIRQWSGMYKCYERFYQMWFIVYIMIRFHNSCERLLYSSSSFFL